MRVACPKHPEAGMKAIVAEQFLAEADLDFDGSHLSIELDPTVHETSASVTLGYKCGDDECDWHFDAAELKDIALSQWVGK